MIRVALLLLAALSAINLAAGSATPTQPAVSNEKPLAIKCEKDEDAIGMSIQGGKTVLSIKSPSGISGASIERRGDDWPDGLVFRIHLRGLESLNITRGDTTLHAEVLSHDGNPRLLHLIRNGKEGPQLTKDEPYWMDIQTFDKDGKPVNGLPPEGGWFEMRIPKALLADAGTRTLMLKWIDFLRE